MRETMVDNIRNTMTDRCAVNQAAIRLIDEWKKKLNVLHCNLHPLDTIASVAKKCLWDMEEKTELDQRKLSKSGCVSEQILAAFDKLR